ncbi:MAG: TIGR02996 domain-containing protein [Gemmataceae bacterium]|nr:TIGR02996 domain-containing protein [Gemmataceae bacterium]
MAVYFVYRSHYEGPSLKHLKRFSDATVLDWFRNRWKGIADLQGADQWVEQEMGCPVYGFAFLFHAIAEHGLPVPKTSRQLQEILARHSDHLYLLFTPHAIQVMTDDNEVEMAYYFFDDHFLARHSDRAAFLLNEGWRLPGGQKDGPFRADTATNPLRPRGRWTGTTYCVFLAYFDYGNLTNIEGAWRLNGVRLPQLCLYLAESAPTEAWPPELRLLRSQLFVVPVKVTRQERAFLATLRENPSDDATWQVYSDWLEERGQPRAPSRLLQSALQGVTRYRVDTMRDFLDLEDLGLSDIPAARQEFEVLVKQVSENSSHRPALSVSEVEDHVAQVGLHTARWGWKNLYHHWIFFDDLWAAAHPELARAILRYAARWDVLSA